MSAAPKPARAPRAKPAGPSDYSARSIQVLKGLEAVRKRPGMYIGSTSSTGLHHLAWEVLDNAVDEAMGGFCTEITMVAHADGSLSVQDNGRGIPTDLHPTEKKSGVELALTVLHAGGKFDRGDGQAYSMAGGLHGVGVSVVNALSARVTVTVDQRGQRHVMEFQRGGVPVGPLRIMGKAKGTGTRVQFLPDPIIFTETTAFDRDTLITRLQQTAALQAGLKLHFIDERVSPAFRQTFHAPQGLAAMVQQLNQGKTLLHPDIVACQGSSGAIQVAVALQYTTAYSESVHSFANGVGTGDGGSHETGFRAALTAVILQGLETHGTAAQKKIGLRGDDLKEGLTAVIAVRVPEPQFEGQTKSRLTNSEVRGLVQTFVTEQLKDYFARKPRTLRVILEKVSLAAKGREEARKAREVVRAQKSALDTGVLPGKLADCGSNDPAISELFIVEGDSAGGSAKQGRERRFQAILPLKGKILNVEKAPLTRILDSEEIRALVTAIGTGFGAEFDATKLRYHKIILMTDADVDGAHIRTLLLTLLFRHFPSLITDGRIFVAQPPLYRVSVGKEERYCFDEAAREAAIRALTTPETRDRANTVRFKGLGEMSPEQLATTTMDPTRRLLLRVTLEDAIEADQMFSMLMGDEVAPRREWIMAHAQFVKHLDV